MKAQVIAKRGDDVLISTKWKEKDGNAVGVPVENGKFGPAGRLVVFVAYGGSWVPVEPYDVDFDVPQHVIDTLNEAPHSSRGSRKAPK